jgi:hypothetical protein
MKTTMKAAILLLSGTLFFSQASLAGKPDNRDPSEKECPNADLQTRCSAELNDAYDLIGDLYAIGDVFLSKNAERDAGTLQCKVSGAEIKVGQDKTLDASDTLYKAIEKVMSLEGQGKMDDPNPGIQEALMAAKACVDNP